MQCTEALARLMLQKTVSQASHVHFNHVLALVQGLCWKGRLGRLGKLKIKGCLFNKSLFYEAHIFLSDLDAIFNTESRWYLAKEWTEKYGLFHSLYETFKDSFELEMIKLFLVISWWSNFVTYKNWDCLLSLTTKRALFSVPQVRRHGKNFTMTPIEICWYILIYALFAI